MNAIRSAPDHHTRILWVAVALALLAALSYVLMALNVLGVGDLQMDEKPAVIIYVAAGCYLLGGLLILLRNRWLMLFGAVMFSPGGLVSKIAQILLEVVLMYVITLRWRKAPNR